MATKIIMFQDAPGIGVLGGTTANTSYHPPNWIIHYFTEIPCIGICYNVCSILSSMYPQFTFQPAIKDGSMYAIEVNSPISYIMDPCIMMALGADINQVVAINTLSYGEARG